MLKEPIIDLHCDLLSFLTEDPSHTIFDDRSNASYPQMQKGGVGLQTLAIFTKTEPSSFIEAKKQVQKLEEILFLGHFKLFSKASPLSSSSPQVIPAFENASGFCSESMKLEDGLSYLESVLERFQRIFYISLTWDGENRFGGGNGSKIGLKPDGKEVLQWMSGKNIAIDLSHTSDFLADDIINYLDKKSLSIALIASHSNLRSIEPKERNLPEFLVKEIISRQGLIGLNFFAPFLGKKPDALLEHVKAFLEFKAEHALCFGADFFPNLLSSYVKEKYNTDSCFFESLGNSSCYPFALSMLESHLPKEFISKIAHQNALNFIKKNL
jgi:microsomal dipeptidase-like Zn-dependent dipeptidase